MKVEMPLRSGSSILSRYKTIGDLKSKYPKLEFVKYIFTDPKTGMIRGVNPPNEIPLVPNSYITLIGEDDEVIKFATAATTRPQRF
jgi:hypothetical protein